MDAPIERARTDVPGRLGDRRQWAHATFGDAVPDDRTDEQRQTEDPPETPSVFRQQRFFVRLAKRDLDDARFAVRAANSRQRRDGDEPTAFGQGEFNSRPWRLVGTNRRWKHG